MEQNKKKEIQVEDIFNEEKMENIKNTILNYQQLEEQYIKDKTKGWGEEYVEEYLYEIKEDFKIWYEGYLYGLEVSKK